MKSFDDFRTGDEFPIPSRTVTEAHFALFQALSGDNHPIHYDREYCKSQGHRDLLAHGFQVLAFTAAGAGQFPHVLGESLIGFVEQSSRFLKGVFPGDTLHLTVRRIQQRSRVWRYEGKARVEGALVAEAEISAMIVDTPETQAIANQNG